MVLVLRIKALMGILSLCQADEMCTIVGDTKASYFDTEKTVYLEKSQNMFAFEHRRTKGPLNSSVYRSEQFICLFCIVHSIQELRRGYLFIPQIRTYDPFILPLHSCSLNCCHE